MDLGTSGWVTATIEPQFEDIGELYDALEGHLAYKDAQLYVSTYNGYDCLVLINDRDDQL